MAESRSIPFFPRDIIAPPGRLEQYGLCDYSDSLDTVGKSSLSPGEKGLLYGLLGFGGVVQFPGGVGLDYATVFKKPYRSYLAASAIEEIADDIEGQADAILAPQNSAIPPATHLAGMTGLPLLQVVKNGDFPPSGIFAAQVDSYTGGKKDTLWIDEKRIQEVCNGSDEIKFWGIEDIIDTGAMMRAILAILEQARKAGYPVGIAGATALFEKIYTGAGKNLREEYGLNAYGILRLEDMGMDPSSWIKVEGIDTALSFAKSS